MTDMQFTPTQQCAIDSRSSTVLVSAAAGSGKTRVLTERLMAYLTDENDPQDIDRFLIITFTKAAAGELRSRILSGIAAETAAHPHLRRQTALCARAKIGTIHSFCGDLLREHCAAAALSPDFQIADENLADALKAATLEKVLEAAYTDIETDEAFRTLADTVGAGRDDWQLSELILQLYDKMQSHARPERWAAEQKRLLALEGVTDAAETPWGQELLDAAKRAADYWCGALDLALAEMEDYDWLWDAYGPSMSETAETLREARRAMDRGWDAAADALQNVVFPKLGSVRKPPDPEARDRAKAAKDQCKKAVDKLKKQFSQSSAKMLSDLAAAAPSMMRLLDVTLRFTDAYAAEKRQRDLVDYNDLEHMAARLLTNEDGSPTELARTVSQRFREILVDEYQDVSKVQDQIFRAVSDNGRNLFFVGDVKQSIYRFRLADPTLFLDKYRSFAPAESAAPGESRRILLQENFRSRGAVLDACNHVFRNIMSQALGELDYDEDASLRCGLPAMAGGEKPELCLLELPGEPAEPGEDKHTLEADYVAGRMLELNRQGVPWEDMVILLRSANTAGPAYRQALTARGVPVTSEQGSGFFESLEISMVRSLLAVIDNPHQDVPLVAALSSPLFAMDANALSRIREAERDRDLYDALCARAEGDEEAAATLETIRRYRRLAPDSTLTELLWRIYDDRDLMALCSAMPDGDQRLARLHQLLALTETFERTGYQGLHRFLQWLDQQEAKGREPGEGAGDGKCVRIMSIHHSKGLEFPVVFLCDLSRKFNQSDSSAAVLVHPRLGLGPKRYDLARGVHYPTFARSAIAHRLVTETLSEEMRLLYVAMTRAKERLILTGTFADVEKTKQKLAATARAPLPPEVLRSAGNRMQWLLQTALLPGGEDVFEVKTVDLGAMAAAAEAETQAPVQPEADPEVLRRLETQLTFAYPHSAAASLPSKVTATELKHAGLPDPESEGAALLRRQHSNFRMPDFRGAEKPLTPQERGTATHRVLQYLRFADARTTDGIAGQIRRLTAEGYLSARDAEAVKIDSVEHLLRSDLGPRLLAAEAAGTVRREFRFSLLFPASRLLGGTADDEVLLQGVVDCWWEEADGIVILDYKTDRIRRDAVPERTAFYASQLRAYGDAMARITGKRVKQRLLYFLHNGVVSEVI